MKKIEKIITILILTFIIVFGSNFTAKAQGFYSASLSYSQITETSVKAKFSVYTTGGLKLKLVQFSAIGQDTCSILPSHEMVGVNTITYVTVDVNTIYSEVEVTLTGLVQGTNYNLKAVCLFGTYSAMIGTPYVINKTFTTPGNDIRKPTAGNNGNFKLSQVAPYSMKLTWEHAIDNKTATANLKYKIYHKAGEDCGSNLYCWETNSDGSTDYLYFDPDVPCAHVLTGINLNNNTGVIIVVEDEAGNKKMYGPKYIQYGDTQGPIPTGEITVGTVTEGSIQFSWPKYTDDYSPQEALDYEPYYYKVSEGTTGVVYMGRHTDITTYTFTNLDFSTEYFIGLHVYDEAGNFRISPYGEVATLTSSAPTVENNNLTVEGVTSDVIFLSWNAASLEAGTVKYRVFVTYDESSPDLFELVAIPHEWSILYDYDATSCIIAEYLSDFGSDIFDDLEPQQTYYFCVQAYNAADPSKYVYYNAGSATTIHPDIEAPNIEDKTVTVENVSSNSISISFHAATDDFGSENLHYRVSVHPDPDWPNWDQEWANIQNGGEGIIYYNIDEFLQGGGWPLMPNTTYYIRVWVVDLAYHWAFYDVIPVTTLEGNGIIETSEEQIFIYPNPASDKLRMENGEWRIGGVEIYNLNGIIVKRIDNPSSEIDVSDLQRGIYFIKIKTEKGEVVRKLKIEN